MNYKFKGGVMGYRIVIVFAVLVLFASCSAFDHGSTPYEGFAPSEIPQNVGVNTGIYSGFYSGNMTVDSNSCAGVSQTAGSAIPLSFDVVHSGDTINVAFDNDGMAAGSLDGDKAVIMTPKAGVKTVYYFTFEQNAISGNAETIEVDAEGQYGDPCATYSLDLSKGERS